MKEKRQYVRLDVLAEVEYKIKDSANMSQTVVLKEISFVGIRMLTSDTLAPETVLELNLKIPQTQHVLHAEGRVVWQRKITKYLIDTGIKFTRISNEDKERLSEYIKKTAGRIEEKREFVRCVLNAQVKYRLKTHPETEKICLSADISGVGLKVIQNEKLEKDVELEVWFNLPNDPEQIFAKGIVAWCRQTVEILYEVGIEFTRIKEQDRDKICSYVKKILGVS